LLEVEKTRLSLKRRP